LGRRALFEQAAPFNFLCLSSQRRSGSIRYHLCLDFLSAGTGKNGFELLHEALKNDHSTNKSVALLKAPKDLMI
jgi:hypothetical protein